VVLISVHEDGRWPYSGRLNQPQAPNVRNFPVPRGFCDSELRFLMHEPILAIASRVRPEAIVITAGADCLQGDPLSSMALSNQAFWEAVMQACTFAPLQVVLGGGGYNPWTTARAWAGLWARLAGFEIPAGLPQSAIDILMPMTCDLVDDDERQPFWTSTLADPANPGHVRDEVKKLAAAASIAA
ncbi:MAG: hypothetical protein R3C46_17150, partial [Hyphomonadaceae bacterium]